DVREAEEKVRKVIARYPGPRYKREQKTAEKPIIQVELWSATLTDADMLDLTSLPDLRELSLVNCRVTPVGLRQLVRLQGLRSLALSRIKGASFYPDQVFQQRESHACTTILSDVAQLKELESLSLVGLAVTDADLKVLANLRKLRQLCLYET